MLVRYLSTRCPSTPELAAFAASTSKELLSDKMLATILQVHILDCPVHLNVFCFAPPIIKFWPKGPPKKRLIATQLNSRQKCFNQVKIGIVDHEQ